MKACTSGVFYARPATRIAEVGKRLGKIAGAVPFRDGLLLSPEIPGINAHAASHGHSQDVRRNRGAERVESLGQQGDVISMIGSSGSGKSTFLRCLNFLERPTQGTISLGGEPLELKRDRAGDLIVADAAKLRAFQGARHHGVPAVQPVEPHDRARECHAWPMRVHGLSRAEAGERADRYLTRVGVWHRKDAYPAFLSGGEQQRVAIARR